MPDPGRPSAPPPSPIYRIVEDEARREESQKKALSAQLFEKLKAYENNEKRQSEPIKSLTSALSAYRRGLLMEHEVVRIRKKERTENRLKRRRLNSDYPTSESNNKSTNSNSVGTATGTV